MAAADAGCPSASQRKFWGVKKTEWMGWWWWWGEKLVKRFRKNPVQKQRRLKEAPGRVPKHLLVVVLRGLL